MAKQPEGPRIGDNSLNGGQLKAFIERIERLTEEKKGVAGDIKDIYAEAREMASTRRSCARLCASAPWTKRSGAKKKKYSIYI